MVSGGDLHVESIPTACIGFKESVGLMFGVGTLFEVVARRKKQKRPRHTLEGPPFRAHSTNSQPTMAPCFPFCLAASPQQMVPLVYQVFAAQSVKTGPYSEDDRRDVYLVKPPARLHAFGPQGMTTLCTHR